MVTIKSLNNTGLFTWIVTIFCLPALAATYTSNGSGNFRTITWTPSVSDFNNIAGDKFIIRDGDAVVLASDIEISELEIGEGGAGATFTIGNDATARNLTINQSLTVLSGSSFTLGGNSATHAITISGDIVHDGSAFNMTAGTDVANVTINSSITSVISGNSMTFNDLTVNGKAALIILSTLVVSGDFIADSTGTDVSTSSNIDFEGDFSLLNGATFTATTSTTDFDGVSDQVLILSDAASFNGVYLDNSNKTVIGNLVVDGTLTITSDAAIIDSTSTNQHQLAYLTVYNPNGTQFDSSSITLRRSYIRYGANNGTDGLITLGNEVDVTIDSWCQLERDDSLQIDGDLHITTNGYLILHGVSSSPVAGEADSKLLVTGSRTLTMDNGADLYLRGYDNFPDEFASYSLNEGSLVRYDQDYNQIVRSENDAGQAIDFGRLYLSQGDGVAQVKRNLFTGHDSLLLSGQLDLVNGLEFEVTQSAVIITEEDIYVDDGSVAGSPVFDADNTILILDANINQTIDGPVSGNYEVSELRITNSQTPSTSRTINIDDNILIGANGAFTVQNPNGSASNTIIVDIDDNIISGFPFTAETFVLGSNCLIYTSTDDEDGFAQYFDGTSPADSVNIDSLSTIRFDRNGVQSIPDFNGGTLGSVQFNGSGNKYVTSNLNIKGDVSRIGGSPVFRFGHFLFMGSPLSFNFSHTVLGDWNMALAYTGDDESNGGSNDPSITFAGGDQIISASDFVNVTFSGSGTKTITGSLLIDGDLTINTGVTVNAGTEAIDIAGNWTENGTAVFTQTGSITDFNGGGTQTMATQPSSQFYNLYITNSTTLDLNSSVQTGYHLYIENGSTLDLTGQTANIKKDLYINSRASISYSDPTNSIIHMNGDVEQNLRNIQASQNLPSLQFSGSGNKELVNNNLTIEGDITISSESTFDANGFRIDFEGENWTNNGNFNHYAQVYFVNSGGSTTVSTSTFHDMYVGDGTVTTTVVLAGNISLDGELDILANGTLDVSASNYSITVEEDWNNYGVFVSRLGTVNFIGNTSDFRTYNPSGSNTGNQSDKSFYNLTINLSAGQNFLVQRDSLVLNDQIDIMNDLNVESGNFYLYENDGGIDPGPALANVAGDLIVTDGALVFAQDNAKIVMNGSSGTHQIDLGGDQVRDFEINASGATYQLIGNFIVRDNVNNEFTMTAGTLDLNGNSLTINRGGLDMTGGTLIVDESASLILNDLATNPDFNKSGGTLQIVGVQGNPATFGAVDAGGFTFTQSGGDIQARYYTISSTSGEGLRIEGGTIDGTTTGNNFSDGTFTSGINTTYMTLANLSLGSISATNVIFNAGPTYNVAVDTANDPTGTFEFVIAGGTLAGAGDEFDEPDGGAATGFIRWNEDPGLTWVGGTSTDWNNAANWSDVADIDADNIPDSDDIVYIESGTFNPVIAASDSFAVERLTIRSSGTLTFEGDGALNVRGNFTNFSGCTVDMTANSSSRLYVAGAWSNAGTFNEGQATVVFNGTDGIHSITTLGDSDPFYNLTIAGDDSVTYTLGSVVTVTNSFVLSGGTCDASSGFNFRINKDWLVNGGTFEPGQGLVRFNGTSGGQSISGGTLNDVYFEGAATKSIDGIYPDWR